MVNMKNKYIIKNEDRVVEYENVVETKICKSDIIYSDDSSREIKKWFESRKF